MPNEDYLLEESVLKLSGLRDITPEEIKARKESGPIPSQNKQSNYYQTSISPSFQHDTSFVGTEVASPRYPKTAIMPLGLQGNPISNAAITSTIKIVGGGTPAPVPSGKIELKVPSIFTPTDQTVSLPGPLVIGLALESPGTVFGVPTQQVLDAGFDIAAIGGGLSLAVSATVAPTQTGDYALFFGAGATSAGVAVTGTPSGFSLLDASMGLSGQVVSGDNPFTVSNTMGPLAGINPGSAGILALLTTGGMTPSIVQRIAGSGAFVIPGSVVLTFGAAATVGNTVIVLANAAAGTYIANNSAGFGGIIDNKGNSYPLVASASTAVGAGTQFTKVLTNMWMRRVDVSGITGFTINFSGAAGDVLAGVSYTAYELSGVLPNTNEIPRFLDPFATMGPINLQSVNTGGGITGLLGLANGGTSADLSVTGGTNQVLFQTSAGAPITVGSLDYNKLQGAQLATKYNNVTLHGLGLVSIVGVDDSTSNAADIPTTFLSTGSPSGLFRVTFYMIVTQAASISSTLPSITIGWLDPDNSTAQTVTFAPTNPTGNSLTTYLLGQTSVYDKPGASGVSYATTGYTSVGATPMTYSVHIRVEQLGF